MLDAAETKRWARLYALAVEGLVTVTMAREVGIDPTTLRRKARREGWPKLQEGVWALPGTPVTHRLRCLAILYVTGERALIARRSAAYERGLVTQEPDTVEVVVPFDRRLRKRPGVAALQSRTLRQADADEANGLRLTTAARTLRDLAAVLHDEELLYTAIRARQRQTVTVTALREQHDQMGTAAGRRRLGWVLDQMHELDSGFEWTVRRGITAAGLPPPHPQPYGLACPDGRTINLDIAWPAWRVGVEVASLAWHNAAQQSTDHLRHNQATVATWRVLYIGWERWHRHRERFLDELRGTLRLAGAPV